MKKWYLVAMPFRVDLSQHDHQRRYEENKMQGTHAPAVALLATS
jgi:hypothetical protein